MDELAHRIRGNLVRIFRLHEGKYDRSFVTHGSVSQFNRWLRSLLRHDPCLVSTFPKHLVFWSNKPAAGPINESEVGSPQCGHLSSNSISGQDVE